MDISLIRSLKLTPRYNLSDSVENSFCDKLSLMASRQEKDRAELEVREVHCTVEVSDQLSYICHKDMNISFSLSLWHKGALFP